MSGSQVLVVDDERNIRKILHAMLQAEGYHPLLAENLAEAKSLLGTEHVEAVLTDLRLKGENGAELVKWVRSEGHLAPVIILTAHGTVDTAVESMKSGAFDYLSKPFERHELLRVIKKAILTYQFASHHAVKHSSNGIEIDGFPMIGRGKKIKAVFSVIDKVANSDSTVLITGESGTGKELIAEAVHRKSDRVKQPFIKINCAAIPSTLMESELFGYERGAFTGAVSSKPGRFELADGGTLFLDEIGDMSVEMQVKLLRVLQDGTFERVGGLKTIHANVRLVTATNKDLESEVQSGNFREDLFYRLNVVPVVLPPLRDRKEDIPLLVSHFLSSFSLRMQKKPPHFTPECLQVLSEYEWPGNIRQLENVIERFIVMREGESIGVEDLPPEVLSFKSSLDEKKSASLKDRVKDATREVEKKVIIEALELTSNNVTQAAKQLNISRKGLQLKMKELGLR